MKLPTQTSLLKLTLCLSVLIFGGCSTVSTTPITTTKKPEQLQLDDQTALIKALYQQHEQWQGTPYQLGGVTKQGIDCSAFVQKIYQMQLGHTLPRTTLQQQQVGKPVQKTQLQAGDLVFFKTGQKLRHVGIYIENERFIHASTSKGVIISSLSNPYWQKAYWKATRPY